MQVNSAVVGTALKEFKTEVTQRKINNYAAAIFDANPHYLDDSRPEGLIAPPTLASALTWPIIQNIENYSDLGYPPELLFQIVHYSEQILIHRPMKPGDKLTIRGKVAAVLPEKRGTHIIFELPAFDQNNNPLFTEYLGGMLRGVECSDAGKGIENIPPLPPAPDTDRPLWEAAVPISREDCYIYEGCSDVIFPIHTSPSFARSVGLPDIIYFGMATLAQALRELINRENGADPTAVRKVACKFRGMVLPGSFIRIQLLQREGSDRGKMLYFRVLNQEGKEAISCGYLHFDLEKGRIREQ